MAAVDVTISGVLYDKHRRTTQQVVLIGEATVTGVGIGGGPIIPPGAPGGAHPEHPIFYPGGPVDPGYGLPIEHPSHPIVLPGDPSWGDPHPAHPIVLPPPNLPTEPPTEVKPPPPGGGWAWSPEWGWGYYPGPANPGPKANPAPKK